MIARIVSFELRPERLDDYRRLFAEQVEPVNRDHKCQAVHSLQKRDDAGRYAIMSLWHHERDLSEMRASDRYQQVLEALRDLVQGDFNDVLWQSVSDVG